MKYSGVIVAALAAVASAQDISIFPECSLPCILDAISKATSCTATDFVCVCKNMDALTAAATACVVEKCGFEVATGKVLPATKEFCANVDTGAGASNSNSTALVETTTAATPASTVAPVTESSTPSPAANGTTTPTTAAPVVVTTSTSSGFSNGTTTKTGTTTAPSSVFTAGAASLGSIGAAAVLMVAAFAL